MKSLFDKNRLIIIGTMIILSTLINSNKAFSQFNFILGLKYSPTMSFGKFDNNQYISHAFDLRSGINYIPMSFNGFLRIGNIRVYKKFDMNFEIGMSILYFGNSYKILGNYTGNDKRYSKHTTTDLTGFRSFPINIYFLTNPSTKNVRKYFKIGATILHNSLDGTLISTTDLIYPDANPLLQDTMIVTRTTNLVKQTKITVDCGIGIEKIVKQKYIFNFGIVYNQGFSTILTTNVEYTIDKINFNNRVLNKGSYLGFELSIANNLSIKRTKRIKNKK